MFTGEHVGASRDNFSTNLARLKNLGQRVDRFHRDRDAVLAQVAESGEGTDIDWMGRLDLPWMAYEQRVWYQGEHHTTLEMMFIYLISMLDVYFGQWAEERGLSYLWGEDAWPPADPQSLRKAGLHLRPAVEQELIECRARRDVLVHRGGVADAKYCKRVQDETTIGRRLSVDESYLDTTVEFVDYLVAAIAVAKYEGPPRHEAREHWPSLVARVFARVTAPAPKQKTRGWSRPSRGHR